MYYIDFTNTIMRKDPFWCQFPSDLYQLIQKFMFPKMAIKNGTDEKKMQMCHFSNYPKCEKWIYFNYATIDLKSIPRQVSCTMELTMDPFNCGFCIWFLSTKQDLDNINLRACKSDTWQTRKQATVFAFSGRGGIPDTYELTLQPFGSTKRENLRSQEFDYSDTLSVTFDKEKIILSDQKRMFYHEWNKKIKKQNELYIIIGLGTEEQMIRPGIWKKRADMGCSCKDVCVNPSCLTTEEGRQGAAADCPCFQDGTCCVQGGTCSCGDNCTCAGDGSGCGCVRKTSGDD